MSIFQALLLLSLGGQGGADSDQEGAKPCFTGSNYGDESHIIPY